MKKKSIHKQIIFLIVLIIGTVLILKNQAPFQTNQGLIFGTMYKITYQSKENLQDEIDKTLKQVDFSLSPFNKKSVITSVNNNTNMQVDSLFTDVFYLAQKIAEETHGAFDITVAPLVNAWGFGFDSSTNVDSTTIDSLREFVGYNKVSLLHGRIIKTDPRIKLDCSSIAKGYGVDCVARLFDKKGIENYMIDIGGELVMKGKNSKMNTWRIGINKPVEDSLSQNQELQTVLELTNAGLATSGNYRNFYYKEGKKYAHTIDPRIGYPVQHSILSATVVAKDCATADAYATSIMVLGLDSAKAICERHPELDAYFIYATPEGKNEIFFTEGMSHYIRNK